MFCPLSIYNNNILLHVRYVLDKSAFGSDFWHFLQTKVILKIKYIFGELISKGVGTS